MNLSSIAEPKTLPTPAPPARPTPGSAQDPTRQPVLAARDLAVGYRHPRRPPVVVVDGLRLSLLAGELVCLLGPNGAGKSTLLRTLAGLQPPLAGHIWLEGEELGQLSAQALARRLSIVLTERVDVGNLSAWGLVALGRHPYTGWTGRLSPQDRAAVAWAIQAVGAEELAPRLVSELSDGERQKVMIARALAQEPRLMLLDEPTAFLDLPRRVEIMGMLRNLAQETRRAILLSTHDLDLALRSADRIWLLAQDGSLQVGAPEDLILSGAFQATFRSDGVEFDPQAGSFRISQNGAGTIHLLGEGLALTWTRRALERVGFQVVEGRPDPRQPTVQVVSEGRRTVWQLAQDGQTRHFPAIYDLLQALKPRA